MLNRLNLLLNSQGFIPHGHCYLWKPGLVWLHVVSDGAIAIAYFSIPLTLLYFTSKRKDVPFNWIFCMFGAFIVACGSGHLMDIWTLWHPTYWLAGLVKACTAIISVITALELIPLVPKALILPSSAQLEAANRELEQTLLKLRQAQSQLVQTEKMSSLGHLVAGVAHEINNPVNFIHGNLAYTSEYADDLLNLLSLYQQHYPQPVPAIAEVIKDLDLNFVQQDFPKILLSMKLGTERVRQIVLSLRNFSRLDESEIKTVDIHEGIDSTLLILQHRLKPGAEHPGIRVSKAYGQLPLIECYVGQLNQVFMNVLSNAIDALEASAQFSLAEYFTSDADPETAPTIHISTELLEANQVLIKISDNGPGISEAIQRQLFDPFFTTKPAGKGTGLGLSISYQIVVEKHKGQLECTSTLNQGTAFLIKIPVQQLINESTLFCQLPSSAAMQTGRPVRA